MKIWWNNVLDVFVLIVCNTSVMTERPSEQIKVMLFDLYTFQICIRLFCNNQSLYFTW